jgi:prefoldin subunit 5
MAKNEEVSILNKELNGLYEENRSYNEHLNNLRLEHARFLNQSQSSFKTLTEEIEKLKNRPAKSSQSNQEIQAAIFEREKIRNELDSVLSEVESLNSVIQQKDETIDDLDKNLDILQKRNESLLEALNANYSQFSQPAEPPPEQSSLFMPIVDIYPQPTHSTLVADVGSTGAWIERDEEQKEAHMASPDPFENLLHQATGETVYQLSEDIEAATPPIDQPWAFSSAQEPELESERRTPPASQRSLREEESKGPGTPKREEARSRPSSRSSTPPRNMYERSSPAPQQPTSQRVHNLIQPQNPRHYSIPCNPFSSSLEPEDDDFFSQMMKETKKPKKMPQSFFE